MKKYTVEITSRNSKGSELLEYWEISRKSITRQDFHSIIGSMFFYAADSHEFSNLTARVRNEDQEVFAIQCLTTMDGSDIWSDISVGRPGEDFSYVRRMQVAA